MDLPEAAPRERPSELLDQEVPTLPLLRAPTGIRDDHEPDLRLAEERPHEAPRIRRVPVGPRHHELRPFEFQLRSAGGERPGLLVPPSDHTEQVVARAYHLGDILPRDDAPVDDQRHPAEPEPLEQLEGRIQRDRVGEGAGQRLTEDRVVIIPGGDQTEASHGADGAGRWVVADLGPRTLAAVVGLLGAIVESGGGLAGTVAPATRGMRWISKPRWSHSRVGSRRESRPRTDSSEARSTGSGSNAYHRGRGLRAIHPGTRLRGRRWVAWLKARASN